VALSAGRGIERSLVLGAGSVGCIHGVPALEGPAPHAVLAEALYVFAADDRKRVEDVVDLVALDFIEPEDPGVQLGADDGSAVLVPWKRRASVTEVSGEGSQVGGRVDELQDARLRSRERRA
jgi:hypothetical protein